MNDLRSTINDTIAILSSASRRSGLQQSPVFRQHRLLFAKDPEELVSLQADAYMDLLFETDLLDGAEETGAGSLRSGKGTEGSQYNNKRAEGNAGRPDLLKPNRRMQERAQLLSGLLPAPVFVNSVIYPLSLIHPDFIRINGWPGFAESELLEAAAAGEQAAERARKIFGQRILFVQDVPGLVAPRIIAMIIREAFYTLEAGTASREEIDTAMKLGTGYPFGPFEWAGKIGMPGLEALLAVLERDG
jgi:hypothetical protein